MRKLLALIALGIACLPALGWQLQPLSLEERVKKSSVVVLGVPVAVLERKPSLFDGAGDELRVQVRVNRVLKGRAPELIVIWFSEAAVQDPPGFVLNSPRVWLLKDASHRGEYLAPAYFTNILESSSESAVLDAVVREQRQENP